MRLLACASLVAALAVLGHADRATSDRAHRPLAVIVAKGSKVTSLAMTDLKRVFTGATVSMNDVRLLPFNHPPSSGPRTGFDRTVLGLGPDEVGRLWVDRKIRGDTGAPRTLPTTATMLKVAARFPGAITYVAVDDVTADVQVVTVDGKHPGDAGYPIWIE